MAVQAFEQNFGIDGHEQSVETFRNAHHGNTAALVNLMEGKKTNAPRPVYDPDHQDNQWPVMVHHAAKGELTVGRSLKGVEDARLRAQIVKDNESALATTLKTGYRAEPYIKPQVAVHDPATEKAALIKRNQELEGQVTAQGDALARMDERLKAMETKS